MKKLAKWVWFLAAAMFASAALAQYPDNRARALFAQPELDQMLAPIALYPDSLLSQILMASTYPREVVEAASWSRANPGLRGEEAVRAVEQEDWDPSVVSLVAFPQVLAMMDARRGWIERLGTAFLDQPDQVMETVQDLRRRADDAGSLRSSEEIVIQRQGNDYVIDPPNPEVVFVPYYDPRVVYGPWWWPNYQPVYWNPWPGYGYRAGYRGFGWGYGISIGSGFFYGAFDWPHRYVRYTSQRPWYHHGRDYRSEARWTPGRDYRRDGRSSYRAGDRNRDTRPRDRDGRADRRPGAAPDRGDWAASDRRDGRATERRAPTPAPAAATPGFFPPPRPDAVMPRRVESPAPQQSAPENPAVRTVSPRYRSDTPRADAPASQPGAVPQRQVPAHVLRPPVGPVPVERPAPVQRAAPVERPAPVERAAPVERDDRPERSSPAERASPVERGGWSRGGGRER